MNNLDMYSKKWMRLIQGKSDPNEFALDFESTDRIHKYPQMISKIGAKRIKSNMRIFARRIKNVRDEMIVDVLLNK